MAGWGTRLRPHTLTVPKPLIKVAGKSVVQRLIDEIMASTGLPVSRIVYVIKPEFGREVESMLRETAAGYGVPGEIVYQDEALGTAHAVWMAKDYLEGPVFIAYADTLFKGNITPRADADAMILVKRVEDPFQFGVVHLDAEGKRITGFVEKPKEFVSDLAIIGLYYFKDGARLRDQIARLIREDIRRGGEYQLTDALTALLEEGMVFAPAPVDKWMDFGNKKAAVSTMRDILDLEREEGKSLRGEGVVLDNAVVVEPCYLGDGVVVRNSRIGPYVSIENGTTVEDSTVSDSLIGAFSDIRRAIFADSMVGNHVKIDMGDRHPSLDLGDYSKIGY